jgi:cephalosporin hydroxylase
MYTFVLGFAGFFARAVKIKISLAWFLLLGGLLLVGLYPLTALSNRKTIERFGRLYYATQPYAHSEFLGIDSMQYPADNWVMQEIINEVRPDFVIETGTAAGGTALFYATVLEKVSPGGKVITTNIAPYVPDPKVQQFATWRDHVEYIQDSSTSPQLMRTLTERTRGAKVLVTLDSNHERDYVLKEIQLYAPLVSVGSYLVVQDTHLGGHPNHHESEGTDGGPWAAVQLFLQTEKNFEIDHRREKHLVTQYPSGFLKRIR